MEVLILSGEDWQGLYINENLIDENHTLGEGGAITYLLEKSEEYNFTLKDVKTSYVTDDDERYLSKFGSFPEELKELSGAY